MDNASGAVLVSTNAERTEAGFGARARARASRRAGSASARARGMEAHPRVSGNAARVLDDRPGPPGGARLETYLTALRPRADMCDARPDDAASAPTRAVREVDEPAVYPDTARHVVAVAIAPPAEHDMSVGTRIRRERAPRFALDSLSQSPSVRDSSPRAASSSPTQIHSKPCGPEIGLNAVSVGTGKICNWFPVSKMSKKTKSARRNTLRLTTLYRHARLIPAFFTRVTRNPAPRTPRRRRPRRSSPPSCGAGGRRARCASRCRRRARTPRRPPARSASPS